jgi:AraC-like DNA-binding protein
VPRRYTGLRWYSDTTEAARPVLTLVKQMILPFGDEGYFVVNVQVSALRQMVESMLDSKISDIDVYDQNGVYLFGNHKAGMTAGSRHSSAARALTKVTSAYTGWTGESNFADKRLFDFFSALNYFWIGIGVLALLAGGLWILYITWKSYQPIQSIISHITPYSPVTDNAPAPEAAAGDEFQIIEAGIRRLIEKSIHAEKQNEANKVYLSQHFMQEFLEGHLSITSVHWKEELRQYGLDPEGSGFVVIVVEIDHYGDFCKTYNVRDQGLMKFVIANVFKELCQTRHVSVWAEWTDARRLSALLPYRAEHAAPAEIAEATVQWVAGHLSFTVTAGIGEPVERLEEAPSSYEDALEALQYKATLGGGRVLDHAALGRPPRPKEMYKHLQSIRSITQSFRLGDDEWQDVFTGMFRVMEAEMLPKDELINAMNYMIYQMYRESMELSEELHEVWERNLSEFQTILRETDTLPELEKVLREMLTRTANQLRAIREQKQHYQLLGEMKAYLEAHFADPDLSLTSLSDRFNLHPNYLSRLFKEEFGEKFVDYVTKLRIARAKKLLEETDLSVQEVAASVGYNLPVSFIRVFKKHVGTTPGDYRKGESLRRLPQEPAQGRGEIR